MSNHQMTRLLWKHLQNKERNGKAIFYDEYGRQILKMCLQNLYEILAFILVRGFKIISILLSNLDLNLSLKKNHCFLKIIYLIFKKQ